MNPSPSEKELESIWNQAPVDYYDHLNIFQRMWHEWKWIIIKHLCLKGIQAPRSILEIGCAAGHLTHLLSGIFPDAQITGIDVYEPAIKEAKKRYPKLKFLVADAQKLPFPDESIDLVMSSETIEHVVSPASMLKEIKRVLTKEGRAVIEMDSGSILFRIVWWFWTRLGRGRVWKDAHLHPFTSHELEDEIKKAGFQIHNKMYSHFGMAVSFLVSKYATKTQVCIKFSQHRPI